MFIEQLPSDYYYYKLLLFNLSIVLNLMSVQQFTLDQFYFYQYSLLRTLIVFMILIELVGNIATGSFFWTQRTSFTAKRLYQRQSMNTSLRLRLDTCFFLSSIQWSTWDLNSRMPYLVPVHKTKSKGSVDFAKIVEFDYVLKLKQEVPKL